MFVGSGRLHWNMLRDFLENNGSDLIKRQEAEIRQFDKVGPLCYQKNQHHKANDYKMDNFDKDEGEDLKKLGLN